MSRKMLTRLCGEGRTAFDDTKSQVLAEALVQRRPPWISTLLLFDSLVSMENHSLRIEESCGLYLGWTVRPIIVVQSACSLKCPLAILSCLSLQWLHVDRTPPPIIEQRASRCMHASSSHDIGFHKTQHQGVQRVLCHRSGKGALTVIQHASEFSWH